MPGKVHGPISRATSIHNAPGPEEAERMRAANAFGARMSTNPHARVDIKDLTEADHLIRSIPEHLRGIVDSASMADILDRSWDPTGEYRESFGRELLKLVTPPLARPLRVWWDLSGFERVDVRGIDVEAVRALSPAMASEIEEMSGYKMLPSNVLNYARRVGKILRGEGSSSSAGTVGSATSGGAIDTYGEIVGKAKAPEASEVGGDSEVNSGLTDDTVVPSTTNSRSWIAGVGQTMKAFFSLSGPPKSLLHGLYHPVPLPRTIVRYK